MMTANGSELATPGVVDVAGQLGLADADEHAGGERDRERTEAATSAVASAASTRFVIVATCSCTIGAIRIAATPASADPSAQFTVAIQSGDRPMADAAALVLRDGGRGDAELSCSGTAPTARR